MNGVASSKGMIYLYCLIRSHDETPLDLNVRGIGESGNGVYRISFLDLAFVVSDTSQDIYETSRVNTMNHQLVCEEVLKKSFTVIPVRFSTTAKATTGKSSAEEKIVKLLRRRYGEFESLLHEMEDKDELGLKVFWNKERLFRDILAEDPNLRRLRNRLATNPHSHYHRIELGTEVSNAIEAKRDVDAQKIARTLSPLSERYETNKILIDMMVLNAAYLVPRSQIAEFDRKVDELDEEYGDRMKFNYIGPVPPFNFVELIIHWDEEEEELEVVKKGKPGRAGIAIQPG